MYSGQRAAPCWKTSQGRRVVMRGRRTWRLSHVLKTLRALVYGVSTPWSKSHENTSKYVDTVTFFAKNMMQRSLTPRWPLTPHLLRSHVWIYPRIIVSKSHGNTSMYVDTVINFANYHIHTHTTYYVHTTYRISDHIVSLWSTFRRDKKEIFQERLAYEWSSRTAYINQVIACQYVFLFACYYRALMMVYYIRHSINNLSIRRFAPPSCLWIVYIT